MDLILLKFSKINLANWPYAVLTNSNYAVDCKLSSYKGIEWTVKWLGISCEKVIWLKMKLRATQDTVQNESNLSV